MFEFKKVRKMQNLGNVYSCGSYASVLLITIKGTDFK